MKDTFGEAADEERKGNLSEASRLYAEAGLSWVNQSDYNPNTTYRIGVAALMASTSCAFRDSNTQRASGIANLLKGLLNHALEEDDGHDPTLVGLYHEWMGDVEFMRGGAHASDYYNTASQFYSKGGDGTQLSWAMEEEFDYYNQALHSYLIDCGYLEEDDELPLLDFKMRIQRKFSLITE